MHRAHSSSSPSWACMPGASRTSAEPAWMTPATSHTLRRRRTEGLQQSHGISMDFGQARHNGFSPFWYTGRKAEHALSPPQSVVKSATHTAPQTLISLHPFDGELHLSPHLVAGHRHWAVTMLQLYRHWPLSQLVVLSPLQEVVGSVCASKLLLPPKAPSVDMYVCKNGKMYVYIHMYR